MNKKVLLIGGIGCGVLLLVCVAFFAITFLAGMGATQPAADAGEAFLTALKSGNYAQAYGLCGAALQKELGSAQGLQRLVESNKAQPVKWSINSRNIANDQAQLEGTIATAGNPSGSLHVTLASEGGVWKVVGFNFSDK